jgi:hypothetical protein
MWARTSRELGASSAATAADGPTQWRADMAGASLPVRRAHAALDRERVRVEKVLGGVPAVDIAADPETGRTYLSEQDAHRLWTFPAAPATAVPTHFASHIPRASRLVVAPTLCRPSRLYVHAQTGLWRLRTSDGAARRVACSRSDSLVRPHRCVSAAVADSRARLWLSDGRHLSLVVVSEEGGAGSGAERGSDASGRVDEDGALRTHPLLAQERLLTVRERWEPDGRGICLRARFDDHSEEELRQPLWPNSQCFAGEDAWISGLAVDARDRVFVALRNRVLLVDANGTGLVSVVYAAGAGSSVLTGVLCDTERDELFVVEGGGLHLVAACSSGSPDPPERLLGSPIPARKVVPEPFNGHVGATFERTEPTSWRAEQTAEVLAALRVWPPGLAGIVAGFASGWPPIRGILTANYIAGTVGRVVLPRHR